MSDSSNHDDGFSDDNISSAAVPAKPIKPNPIEAKWDVGDRILVKYNDTRFYYEGKVIRVTIYDDQPSYRVTYPGWGSHSNEDILHEEAVERFMECTEENRRKAKQDIEQASASLSKKRKSRISGASSGSHSESSSGLSNHKKSKKSRGESPSVTDTPLAAFKSVSHKVKPKFGNKISFPRTEKKVLSPKVEKRLPEVQKKLPEVEKRLPKVEKKLPEVEKRLPDVEKRVPEVEKKPELPKSIESILLTDKLDKIFVEDRRFIVEEDMLPKLPAAVPIKQIMQQYVESLEEFSLEKGKQFSQMVLDRFKTDTVARNIYMFEVPMVQDLLRGKSGFGGLRSKELEEEDIATGVPKDFTALFGITYILRLLVNFHTIVARDARLAQEDLRSFVDESENFVGFLDEHADTYYQGESGYYPASVMYCTRESE